MRRPMMSGHCSFPQTEHPEESHARCRGGNTANPGKEFQPCPCPCHYEHLEQYECDGCGGVLVATAWPNEDPDDVDENGDLEPVYSHLDPRTNQATGQECA